ncbi:ribosome maturation factor RimP [Actinocrinis sp.]|jgi:ribosome maturation factor RimP|uniref:ribosome maturation factor RimP n=1 Tax=Actinocrinis sp. TaxID=1920516 RepID=UPI002C3FEC9E|nr:ribosome maturation factor RimP [Actinocrinis sp.]HXR73966.1 ribosome maturation factor RimP [Actinocrinis sp.]
MSPTAPPRLDRQKLRAMLEPVVERAGAELEDLTEQRAGSRRLIRVVVDRDGGVSMDDVADVTRAVSEALDGYEPMGETAYVLEVTSPGIDRPLTEPRHWRRAQNRLVKVVLKAGGEVVGRVTASDDDGVTLLLGTASDAQGEQRTLAYGEIARARMQVEFNRAAESADDSALDDDDSDDVARCSDDEPDDES